ILALAGRRLPARATRATLQACFCVQDACAVAIFGLVGAISPNHLPLAAVGTLGSLLGWRIGDHYFANFGARTSRRIAVTSMLIAASVTGIGIAFGWAD